MQTNRRWSSPRHAALHGLVLLLDCSPGDVVPSDLRHGCFDPCPGDMPSAPKKGRVLESSSTASSDYRLQRGKIENSLPIFMLNCVQLQGGVRVMKEIMQNDSHKLVG
ncbi:uncharacterized protein [Aegilops tauschii subsp. strangulata]|uniref:uncharacterized protein n=1 Tax=Aegilops tauschii subsp. strangulata TaxID=200361 RepID=UPI00098B6D05|nr:uncharacterized protein LOC109765961 isoform X2 [Aegilops tauschii subsp. strangulata]